jgi:predicted outer membrane repeat protein
MYTVSSSPTLANVTFSSNYAYYGGGMYNDNSSPQLSSVTFNTNSALDLGGGMYNYDSSPTLTNTTFSSNSAYAGGGMFNDVYYHYNSRPTLANVTFSGNYATGEGGGMYNYDSRPTLANVTFGGNHATDEGGGMFNYYGSPTLANCILWGNSDHDGTDQSAQMHIFGARPITVTYSLVQGGVFTGTGNISADPLFVRDPDPGDGDWSTLADNDYGDLRPLPSSPAIDAGDNAAIFPGITTDLDGSPRFFDVLFVADTGSGTAPIIDMGAYEWHSYGNGVLLPLVLKK